jgi:soluble lytic murein transglycosylase
MDIISYLGLGHEHRSFSDCRTRRRGAARAPLSRGSRRRARHTVLRCVLTALASPLLAAAAHAGDRVHFLAAERAIAAGNAKAVARAVERLAHYPLTPYLEIGWAQRWLSGMDHGAVAAVLARHGDVPAAERLRARWFARLAREGRWDQITRAARPEEPDTRTACRVAEALWRGGDVEAAYTRVETIWPNGRSLPKACDTILAAWIGAGRLTQALAWQRVRLAVAEGNPRLARYLGRHLEPDARTLLDRWLKMRRRGHGLAAFVEAGRMRDPRRQMVLMDCFQRLAARNPGRSAALLEGLPDGALTPAIRRALHTAQARALALAGDEAAFSWLDGVDEPRALAAGAALAIKKGRWTTVSALVERMPAELADEARWRYWRIRAPLLAGEETALPGLESLATQRGYYGFLAAQHLGRDYRLRHRPLAADSAAQGAVTARPEATRALEWHALGRPVEARREWRVLLERLPAVQLDDAALVAHRHGWHEAAIRTAARAKSWNDLEVRFPLAHDGAVTAASERSGLTPSRIYAVVRQESAFMGDVRSSAGALGLMQLMPRTARQVARRAGLGRPGRYDLLRADRNLLLGSLYLARLEQRYDGHPVLASAAYNAGPERVRGWQPGKTLSSEIWIETIPYGETRRYVQQVLAYQVIYAHRLGEQPVSLERLMPPVPGRSG